MTGVEIEPSMFTAWDLRVYLASERAGGWAPKHFELRDGRTACQVAGADPGEFYGFTADRRIWEAWYAVGWGCQGCAEVLHS